MEYVNPEGLRQDGRRPKELRQISCELGVLAKASGSATFEMGNTKVLAAVYGPHEASNRSAAASGAIVQCDYAMAPFSTGERRRQGRTDRRSTEISAVIRNTLEQTIITELLPNSQIDIHVQVLQADGGTRCACINAALLALAEAGIPLRDMVAACAAGYLDETALLDLNYIEDSGGGPDISVALHPQFDRVVLLQMDNRLPLETFQSVVELAMKGCKAIASFMREELLEHTRLLAGARGFDKL